MSLPTPPRFGPRLPLPPAPREEPSAADPEAPDEPGIGDLIEGRYQIEARIGEGGVGLVYSALQLKLHRRVAIKLLQAEANAHEEMRPRFQQEALTLAALSHPNIVTLQDYGIVRGRPFLVLELLEGQTLRALLDGCGALAPRRALTLARQVVLALAYAHERGIVHRDLKPANVIVQTLPAHEHVKVLDFGMVKLLPTSYLHRGEALTRAGFTAGTPAYMSPEHATGAEVDGRSDLYSLGILLFELLTGDKPFEGEVQDILRAHLGAPVPRLSERNPALAEMHGLAALQALLDRMLEKDRAARVESAIALLAQIDAVLAELPALTDAREAPAQQTVRAEDDDHTLEDALGLRSSLPPRVQSTLAQGRAAYQRVARATERFWRERGRPASLRASAELRALTRWAWPRLKKLPPLAARSLQRAWTTLRPLLLAASTRAVQGARLIKARIAERAAQRRLADGEDAARSTHDEAPASSPPLARSDVADFADSKGATVRPILALPANGTVSENTSSVRPSDTLTAPPPPAHVETLSFPVTTARDTAEPLVLEPRDPGRSPPL